VRPGLEECFEVLAMDRRGHGASERGPGPHTLQREARDVAVVLQHAGPDALVLAHSWGARCTLAALAGGARPAGAVLYEPLADEPPHFGPHDLAELQTREARDPPGDVLDYFFVTFALVAPEMLPRLRSTREWGLALDAVGTLARESRAHHQAAHDPAPPPDLDVPVRLLVGGETAPGYARTARRLAATLPRAEVHRLEGQGHVAHHRSPALITDQLIAFDAALRAGS
jgi:pimeloyl-ACP methyl ester carboxylesterase